MKTLTANGWYMPYENHFSLSYRCEPIAEKERGYSIKEAEGKARELGYTHLKINPSFGNTRVIKL